MLVCQAWAHFVCKLIVLNNFKEVMSCFKHAMSSNFILACNLHCAMHIHIFFKTIYRNRAGERSTWEAMYKRPQYPDR